jgi:hypothetical protein
MDTTRKFPRDERGRRLPLVNDSIVRAMHAEGCATTAIASALSVHKSSIHQAYKRLGLQSHFTRKVAAGDKFGRLTVVREVEPTVRPNGIKVRKVVAVCECGTERPVRLDAIVSGKTVSCGCYHRELSAAILPLASVTHGMTGSPLHRIWSAMKARCTNPNNKRWADYGGRGIRVCDEWANSFEAFAKHMGPRPAGLTLDRINNDGNYEPGNVRWATHTEQANNRRPRRVQS